MNKLFARQLAKATRPNGEIDTDALGALVGAVYSRADRERRRRAASARGPAVTPAEREADLRAQNLRVCAALNNMSQGLLMFDAGARLVLQTAG